jgi:hypothetical protein
MGLTHAWYRETELDEHAFAAAVEDCRMVVAKTDVPLAGFEGAGEPIFDSDHIVFNGQRPDECEPFEIARVEFDRRGRPEALGYCKTEGLPYDICVQASLVVLKHHLGSSIRVCSDVSDDAWRSAVELTQAALGYGEEFRLEDAST